MSEPDVKPLLIACHDLLIEYLDEILFEINEASDFYEHEPDGRKFWQEAEERVGVVIDQLQILLGYRGADE